MSLSPGARIGAYEIVSLLGVGGMGEVYRARDTRLRRDVAIKVLPAAVALDPDRRARFQREARLLAAINHPHIATIHSLEDVDGMPALVLELLDGPTLGERIAAGPMAIGETRRAATQIADAVAAAHAQGILHRDLKPANIKVTLAGVVKVLDFGLAVPFSCFDGDAQASTIEVMNPPGTIAGTPAYMSPEQTRGEALDQRTDVWAFGCVVYEMLTGRTVFGRATVSDTIAAILAREPDWSALPDQTPSDLRQLLRQCLEKDVQRRLRTIADARAVLDSRQSTTPHVAAPEADGSIHSLAVLPFVNASPDPQMEYLSDGLTESIIFSLSHLPQLRVIARGTVFRYKGRSDDVVEIGRDLGVGAVATGRVLQRGDTLIVSAELIDVENGWQLWGAQYKRAIADIFETEETIAREISAKLRLKLTPERDKLLGKRYTDNVAAYHLYLKGKFYWAKRTQEGLNNGIQHFHQAIEVDPLFALAYAGLAESYSAMGFYGHMPPRDALLSASAAARKALVIDPTLTDARTVLAVSAWLVDFDAAAAERQIRAVIDDDPNSPRSRQVLSEICTSMARFPQAIEEATRALELDPLALAMNAHVALTHYYARRYEAAIERCQRALEMEPAFYPAHWVLGLAGEQIGRLPEAIAEFEQATRLSNRSTFMLSTLGGAYAMSGRIDETRAVLSELDAVAGRKYVSPVLVAQIHAALGDSDRALESLDEGYRARDTKLAYLDVDPRFDTLRGHPRFDDLARRVWPFRH